MEANNEEEGPISIQTRSQLYQLKTEETDRSNENISDNYQLYTRNSQMYNDITSSKIFESIENP